MPLIWRSGENPYRNNYFAILEVGPQTHPIVINAMRKKLSAKLEHGASHLVDGRTVTITEINEAEARLLDEQSWALEAPLVHPAPLMSVKPLQPLCASLIQAAMPAVTPPRLRSLHLEALTPLLPAFSAADIPWPTWEAFALPGPGSVEDEQHNIQFDL